MSYCRWSSDDFQCDVYVYEAVDGYTIHVAGLRLTWLVPLPKPSGAWDTGKFDFDKWWARQQLMSDLLDDETTHVRTRIGLPHDGETFVYDTPGECAEKLAELRDLGYTVPESVIKDLREEEHDRVAEP